MKKRLLLVLLVLMTAVTVACAAGEALPSVERLAAVEHAALDLVIGGKPQFAIVGRFRAEADVRGPEGQTLAGFKRDSVRRAATLLADGFERCTGTRPPVLDEEDAKAADVKLVLALGATRWSEVLGVDPRQLPREGFEIRSFDGGVVIVGRDWANMDDFYDLYNWRCVRLTCNGTEWGAQDFLERFLDVRLYSPHDKGLWTDYPKTENLRLPSIAYRDFPRQWTRAGRMGMGQGWRTAISSDCFGGEAPHPNSLAKAHPELVGEIFFRDKYGKLWQDSDVYGNNFLDVTGTRLADVLADDFISYYRQLGTNTYWGAAHAPSTHYMWFGQCDRGMALDTPRGLRHPRANPIACDVNSEIYGHFYDYLARRCERDLPGKTLVLMAYSSYLKAPRTIERFPDNVQILACIGQPMFAWNDDYMRDVCETYGGWNQLCAPDKRAIPYLYAPGAGTEPIFSFLHGYCMGDFLRKTETVRDPHHYYPCFGTYPANSPLGGYLQFRAAWNPASDADAARRDFLVRMFGADAGRHLMALTDRILTAWRERYIPRISKGKYVGKNLRSIQQTEFDCYYGEVLNEPTVVAMERELASAGAALGDDPLRKRRFDVVGGRFRKTFEMARAYRSLRYPKFDVGRRLTRVPPFRKAFIGAPLEGKVPTCDVKWDDCGLTVDFRSTVPFRDGKGIFDGDSFEVMIAPGTSPDNLYQFACASNGKWEDYHKQLDQPREMDAHWKAQGASYVSTRDEKGWRGRLFLPWQAFYEAAPKAGDVWKINLISNRTQPAEYASISPTFGNNRFFDMYATMRFVEDGERLVRNLYVPRRRGVLEDDADYFPDEYLDTLAREGMTGVWVPISLRTLARTSLTPRDAVGDARMARLRRAAEKCALHGIRLWVFGNEPARFKPGDPLLKAHPELGGAFFPTHGSTMWCPCEPAVLRYVEEAIRDVFTEAPQLGGFLNIAYGEGLTTCLDALECCDIEKYWSRPCARCAQRPVWEGYRKTSEAVLRGIRAAGSDARYVSWFYQPMATPERADFVADCAAHAPEGTTFMFNFESGALVEQLGKTHCCGDYSLAIAGPGKPFAAVAAAARRSGVRLGAKIQTTCSHELATIPDVPVPALLYRKYAAMAACGVRDVMQGWSMGNEPGMMLRAAARLASWDFSRGEDAFLRDLAEREWGAGQAERVVRMWKNFSDAFALYPVDHVVQYLGPFHAGVVWNLFTRPEAGNILAGWKGFAEGNGDRIGETLGFFTLAETEELSRRMSALCDVREPDGRDTLAVLEDAAAGHAERQRQVAMMKAFRLQMKSAADIYRFYRLRADALVASRERGDAKQALGCLDELQTIIRAEQAVSSELIPLAQAHDRLGSHADAVKRIYGPESLARRIVRLGESLKDLEAIRAELAAGRPWPESARERMASRIGFNSETVSGDVRWRLTRDGGDLIVSGTCAASCKGLAIVFSDLAGAGFPVVCHLPKPGTGDGVFEPRQTAGTCRARADDRADGGWTFEIRYPQAKWTARGVGRPEWLTLVSDTHPGGGEVKPLWPATDRPVFRRGDLPWVDGSAFGRLVWPN